MINYFLIFVFCSISSIFLISQEKEENPAEKKALWYLDESLKKFSEYTTISYQVFQRSNKNEVLGYSKSYFWKRKDGVLMSRSELYTIKSPRPFSITIRNNTGVFELLGKNAIKKDYLKEKEQNNYSVSNDEKFKMIHSYEDSMFQGIPVIKVVKDFPESEDEKRILLIKKLSGIELDKKYLTRKSVHYLRKSDLFEIATEEYGINEEMKSKNVLENVLLNVPIDENLFTIPSSSKVVKAKSPDEYSKILLDLKNINK